MKRWALITTAILVAGSICGCNAKSSDGAVQACISRGIAYFKEIEAYPLLSTGQQAEEAASERCNRTVTAFP